MSKNVPKSKTIEHEIQEAFEYWDCKTMLKLLTNLVHIYELYDVDEEENWVKDCVGEENELNIRIVRTMYLLSKISEDHAGALVGFKIKFPKLWERIEKHAIYTK